jgi:hypothetical protein
MTARTRGWVLPSLAVAASCAVGCATVEVQPPARTTVHVAAGPGLAAEVREAVLSEDMLVDEASADSRLVFWIDLDNRDAAPTRVDPQAFRLVVRAAGAAELRLPPTASGWGQLPTNEPPTQALAVELPPHERRRVWVVFEVPPMLRDSSPPQSAMALAVDAEGTAAEIVVASPSGPRWLQPTVGPLHGAITNTTIVAPGTVADALGYRIDLGPYVRLSLGPLFARHDGHTEVGFGASFQLDAPFHLQLSPTIRMTPFLSGEFAVAGPSYPARYPDAEVALLGAGAGVEIGFGLLRPPNADHFPLQYAWPLAPFAVRVAYVRWWGDLDHDSLGNAGRSGLVASLTVRFAP